MSTDSDVDRNWQFTADPKDLCNVTCAVIEYAFITEEIPGNWFGTQFNDYFELSITADAGHIPIQRLDQAVSTANSIDGLGLGAFNNNPFAAATCCYVLNLNIDPRNKGLPITFGVSVSNAIDNLFQSAICGRVYFADDAGNILGP